MKCPICSNTLRISKKDPRFALCDECRKKFRIPQAAKKPAERPEQPIKREDTFTAPSSPEEQNIETADATQVFSRREVREALKRQAAAEKEMHSAQRRQASAAEEMRASQAPSSNAGNAADDEDFHLRYANIPPKEVREKQEREMRKAYDELLSIGKEERETKKRGFFRRRK